MKRFLLLSDPGGMYRAPQDIPGGSVNDATNLLQSDCSVIYDIYDELVRSCPDWVSKQTMGEVSGYPFNRYRFCQPELENTSDLHPRRFKVCIVTSIHGYEQGCAWTAAQFFRLLCHDTADPILAFLRRSVCFEVLPVANPWGFSHDSRKNENGVDLNRNFAPYFLPREDRELKEYGGPAPCSEEETRLVMQFIEDNMDAAVVLDYHNIGRGNPLYYVYQEKDVALAQCVFGALSDQWRAQYPQLPAQGIIGRTRPNGHEGMFADYLLDKGLWAITMETPWCMPLLGQEKYDAPTIRCAVDVLVNTILAIVRSSCC